MKQVCRFEFEKGIDRETIEAQMALSIVVAEIMYGAARVRLGAAYLMADDGRHLAVDVSHEVGAYVAQVFTGLLIRYVGEGRFSVERVGSGIDHTNTVEEARHGD